MPCHNTIGRLLFVGAETLICMRQISKNAAIINKFIFKELTFTTTVDFARICTGTKRINYVIKFVRLTETKAIINMLSYLHILTFTKCLRKQQQIFGVLLYEFNFNQLRF